MLIQAWRHLLKYMRGEDLHLQLNALVGLTSPRSPLAGAGHVGPQWPFPGKGAGECRLPCAGKRASRRTLGTPGLPQNHRGNAGHLPSIT